MAPVNRPVCRQGNIVPCGWTNPALTCTPIDGSGTMFEDGDGCTRDSRALPLGPHARNPVAKT